MPNWCSNSITLKHKDPAMLDRVIKAQEGLLMEFVPTPQDLVDTVSGFVGEDQRESHEAQMKHNIEKYGYADWYQWNINNWGTKWDFGLEIVERVDANTVTATFDSAWAPPVNAYEKLCAMGFEIEAFYYEPGMGFVGKFTGNEEDCDDDCYDYSGQTSDTVREYIGEELDDMFSISDDMAQYEEENDE